MFYVLCDYLTMRHLSNMTVRRIPRVKDVRKRGLAVVLESAGRIFVVIHALVAGNGDTRTNGR